MGPPSSVQVTAILDVVSHLIRRDCCKQVSEPMVRTFPGGEGTKPLPVVRVDRTGREEKGYW